MPGASSPDSTLFDADFLARLERLQLIAKRVAAAGSPGRRPSRALGDGLEFADHRDYAPGDDVRFMDWPYFARMGKLLIRLFHEHSEAHVAIFLDVSASMARPDGAKFDYARRAAAAMAYVACGSLERASIVPFADRPAEAIRLGRDRSTVPGMLSRLAALETGGATDLRACVDRFTRSRTDAGGTAFVISDLLGVGEQLQSSLAWLRQCRWDPVAVHVFSPAETSGDLAGPVELTDAETGETVRLDVTDDLRASYRQRWADFAELCRKGARAAGGTYVAAACDQPFEKLILETLRRAGVLEGRGA